MPETRRERGMALIASVLMLGMLTLIGGALLTTTTIDVRIADNYRTNTQLLFLAEMGIEDGREALRASPDDISTILDGAAGTDDALSTSRDLTTLLGEDDESWLPADQNDRTDGEAYVDPTGRTMGTYHVFLRNDAVDGITSRTDTNDVVTLLSVARIGDRVRIVEVDVKRGGFGDLTSALTLDGPVGDFDAANSNVFHIDGRDGCGAGDGHAIGVINDGDVTGVIDEIPNNKEDNYTGVNPYPDIENVEATLPPNMTTPQGLEEYVESFANSATDSYYPDYGDEVSMGSIGSPSDKRIVAVHGDVEFGPGDGYGILVVRGKLTLTGNFSWYGLVLVIGQGEVRWNGGAQGEINGGMFLANTRENRTVDDPIGTIRSTRGDIIMDFNGGGGNGVFYNSCALDEGYNALPFSKIAIREF